MEQKLDIDTSVWFPDALIPGLKPYGLERVPGFRLKPGAVIPAGWRPTPGEPNPYEDTAWRPEHKAWTRDLGPVRLDIAEKARKDQGRADMERALCAQDPNYFGAVYGWIFDPKPRADEPMHKPFAKFAYQCHNTTAQLEHIRMVNPVTGDPVRTFLWRPKSRQLGISWDDEHFDLWFYLFDQGRAKLVSRSEKWVYNGSSDEAMFGKLLYIMSRIEEHAPYILPGEGRYTVSQLWGRHHFRDMVLTNPITKTALTGESTTKNVARGGTYTYVRPDETAKIPDLDTTMTSLRAAAPHVFPASTEDAEGFWLEMWQAAKRDRPEWVMEFNWHQNAYLDLNWEKEQIATALTKEEREGLWRESFRDPFAGFGVWVYPEARDLPDADRPYSPEEPLDITMDPAGTGDDFAFFACQATAVDGHEGFHVLFGYQRQLPNPLRIANILTGIEPSRGDPTYGWEPDTEERELMRFFYARWMNGDEVRFFMDPAADQIHSGASFWTMFRDYTKVLRQQRYEELLAESIAREEAGKSPLPLPVPRPIAPKFEIIKKHRLMGDREYALRQYLPYVTFQTGVESAAWVRTCWGRTRYNDLSDRAVTEPKRRHDQYSHQASNGEHYAIYYRYRFVDPLDSKALRKIQKGVGLRGMPAGFTKPGIPKGFGRNVGLPPAARTLERLPPKGVHDRGWR